MDQNIVRERLLEERRRLRATAEELADDLDLDDTQQAKLGELSSFDQHQADIGSETFEREKDGAILSTLIHHSKEINEALNRLDEGTYGTCERCGKPIGQARLEAVPIARFCIDDEQAISQNGA